MAWYSMKMNFFAFLSSDFSASKAWFVSAWNSTWVLR